jgi:hypothetical protein
MDVFHWIIAIACSFSIVMNFSMLSKIEEKNEIIDKFKNTIEFKEIMDGSNCEVKILKDIRRCYATLSKNR